MNKISWLLLGALSVMSGIVSHDYFKKKELGQQVRILTSMNRVLEQKYVASQSLISVAQCDAILVKAKIEDKIQHLSPRLKDEVAEQLAEAVIESAKEYKMDPDLVLAIAHAESRFNSQAISRVGALGVMQVMPFWAETLDWVDQPKDLLDVEKNIRAGTFILAEYLRMFHGNRKLALLAYNRGPGTVMNAIKNGNDPDNGYPSLVLASYNRIRKY